MHCTKSVNFTAFGKSLTCTLGPFHHVCFSKAAAFVPSSHKARDQRRCAACFGFRTEQQRLVFTKVNMGSVYIYIYFFYSICFSPHLFLKPRILSSMLFFAYCNLSWFLEIRELLKVIASTFAS